MMPSGINGGLRFANPPYELSYLIKPPKDQLMRAFREK
jgi:hypothetical protein